MWNYRKQHGGTILGLILGLVIGLAIALGVALAITKTPMPFTNKAGKPGKGTDTSADFDPNRLLYGKSAQKDAAKAPAAAQTDASKTPEAKSDLLALVSMGSDTKPESRPAEPKIDDNRNAARNTASAGAAAPGAAPAAEEKWSYYLQAGAFRQQTDAENTRAKLALIGVEARISERESENGTLYRVRIGPFAHMDALNRVRTKLSDGGVDAAVVRVAQ